MGVGRPLWPALVAAALAIAAGGCGSGKPALGTVRGRVTTEGKAVPYGTVLFENLQEGVGQTAPVREDGTYEVKSHEGAGLPPGRYRVAVTPSAMIEDPDDMPLDGRLRGGLPGERNPVKILEKYYKTSTSGVMLEVREGENPPFDLEVGK